MKHEKIYILEDKSKLKVTAELITSNYSGSKASWSFYAQTCAKGKRTWISVAGLNTYCHTYRTMSMDERRVYEFNQVVEAVGAEKLQETADELLELLRFKI